MPVRIIGVAVLSILLSLGRAEAETPAQRVQSILDAQLKAALTNDPAVVVIGTDKGDARNLGASDVLVVPCSTVLSDAPTHVRLRKGEAGIGTMSVLKCEQLGVLRKERLDPLALGGALSEARLRDVERAVLRAIGVPVPLRD